MKIDEFRGEEREGSGVERWGEGWRLKKHQRLRLI